MAEERALIETAEALADSTICIPWSMIICGWPTPKFSPTRRTPPAGTFLRRAALHFHGHGIATIEAVMTDDA